MSVIWDFPCLRIQEKAGNDSSKINSKKEKKKQVWLQQWKKINVKECQR